MNEKLLLQLIKTLLEDNKPNATLPFEIGEKVLIRTVTYFVSGRISAISGVWLTLEDAAWIADTGRFAAAIDSCEFSEVEPVAAPVRVNSEAIIDCYSLQHLPRVLK